LPLSCSRLLPSFQSPSVKAPGRQPSRRELSLLPGPGAKAEVVEGRPGQSAPQPFQQASLLEVDQLLQQDGVVHQYLQHAAAEVAGTGMLRAGRANRLGPGPLEVQLPLPAAPAMGRE